MDAKKNGMVWRKIKETEQFNHLAISLCLPQNEMVAHANSKGNYM